MFGVEKPLQPSQLRWFGLSLSGLIVFFAVIAYWQWQQEKLAIGLAVVALVIVAVYYAVPSSQTAIIRGFRLLVWPIQAVVSILLLGFLYYGVMMPIGLVLRLLGRDPLDKGPDTALTTYWREYPTTNDTKRYFRMY